jgi:hypothetical protein
VWPHGGACEAPRPCGKACTVAVVVSDAVAVVVSGAGAMLASGTVTSMCTGSGLDLMSTSISLTLPSLSMHSGCGGERCGGRGGELRSGCWAFLTSLPKVDLVF